LLGPKGVCDVFYFLLLCGTLNFTKEQSDDGQSRTKHVARSLTFKPYVLMVETKLNRVALKAEVNQRV
jgi:hypothetical protein